MDNSQFKLPPGNTPEDEMAWCIAYGMPKTTKLFRNLALRELRRTINPATGQKFQAREIIALPYFATIHNMNTVYHITRSRMYDEIERDLRNGTLKKPAKLKAAV